MKKETRVALYARCSTHDKGQDPELQLRPLRDYCKAREWTVHDEYSDVGQSGAKDRRPELDRLMNDARKRKVDTVVVWKLDRLGRSLKHLITILDELNALGVGFVSYQDNLDFSTPSGRLMFHLLGAFAEFERDLIKERVKAGISNARAKGKKIGRKPLAPAVAKKVVNLKVKGLSYRTISRKLNVSIGSVHKTLSNSGSVSAEFN